MQSTLHCTVLNRLADTTNQSVTQGGLKKVPVDFVRIHIIFCSSQVFFQVRFCKVLCSEMSRKSSSNSKTQSQNDNEKHTVSIREFQTAIPENKKCFECDQRGPTYVDMTIGSFVCTKCSGML